MLRREIVGEWDGDVGTHICASGVGGWGYCWTVREKKVEELLMVFLV